jgi:hypothetical protein
MKGKWKYIIAAFALIWLFFFVYTISRPEKKAVVDARLPQSTIDYFKRLRDQIVIFNPNPSLEDWINDKAGTNTVVEYASIENDNFIIYFIPDTKSESRAPEVISYADAAIKPLEQLMDRYYYPDMVNGRKLPIFITNNQQEYDNIINRLLGDWADGGGASVGVTLFEVSSLGMRTIAIVLSSITLIPKTKRFKHE